MRYTVLIVGSGGREHTLAWALARSPQVDRIYIAPGNAGTQAVGTNIAISVEDIPALLNFAQEKEINLTIIMGTSCFRPQPIRRPAGILKSFCQVIHGRTRHSHSRLCRLHRL